MTTGRHRWVDALWASSLRPLERLVALAYADHADRDQMIAWVSLTRLMERTGLSRDAANRALQGLVGAGWLTVVEPGRQHRSTRYKLTIPASADQDDDHDIEPSPVTLSGTGGVPLNAASGTRGVPLGRSSGTSPDASGTSPDASGPRGVPDPLNNPLPNPSSSARLRASAAEILGWRDDDDRLDHLEAFLASQARPVGHAAAWLRACHEAGDLDRSLTAYAAHADTAPSSPSRARRRAAEAAELWPALVAACGNEFAAASLARDEAQAMGLDNPRDPAVIKSALITARRTA